MLKINIENFIIREGYAQDGGGMYIENSAPVIKNCTFQDNDAHGTTDDGKGGGLHVYGDGPNGESPWIENCRFWHNFADGENSWIGKGGAIFAMDTTAIFLDCEIGINLLGDMADDGKEICLYGPNHAEFYNCQIRNCVGCVSIYP